MQKATQINRKKQGIDEEALVECDDHMKRVSYLQYLDEKQPRKGKESRLCSDNLMLLKKHINSMMKVHGASCNVSMYVDTLSTLGPHSSPNTPNTMYS